MGCRSCLARQPRSLNRTRPWTHFALRQTATAVTSFEMAGIIPIHSHDYTHNVQRSPPARAEHGASIARTQQKPHIQQQSHYDQPVTQARSATMSGTPNQGPSLRYPSNKKSIYDRNLNRSKNAELSRAAFAYLFIEMIAYAQRGVSNVGDLEQKYATLFYVHTSRCKSIHAN